MIRLILIPMIMLPNFVAADTLSYATSDNQVYIYAGADEDGVLYPEADPTDAYTMNFDCTVSHDTLGKGEWHFANGGWVIEFNGEVKLGFPRQAPPLDVPACAM